MNISQITKSKKKKVSLLLGNLSEKGAGRWTGGSTRPFILARLLETAGYEVELVGFSWSDSTLKSPYQTQVLKGHLLPWHLFSFLLNMHKINGDIIYAYKLQLSSFGFGLFKKFFSKKKLILDIDDWELSWHGGDDWKYNFSFRNVIRDLRRKREGFRDPYFPAYVRYIEKFAHKADRITTHNTYLQKRFGGQYIANCKDTDHFDPKKYDSIEAKKKLGLEQYTSIVFAGAPRPYKGVEDALEAIKILNQANLKFVIVGGSPYDKYDAYLQEKWGDIIIQIPAKTYDEMPEVISAADIMIIPQRDTDETRAQFPLKLTDAMSMEKPLIATRVGDIEHIVEKTGLLVDPESPTQIAKAISWILENPIEAKEQAQLARKRCVEHFSIKSNAEELKKIIEEELS